MKCVVNLYSEENIRESVFEIDEKIIKDLDEICEIRKELPENIVMNLLEGLVENHRFYNKRCFNG